MKNKYMRLWPYIPYNSIKKDINTKQNQVNFSRLSSTNNLNNNLSNNLNKTNIIVLNNRLFDIGNEPLSLYQRLKLMIKKFQKILKEIEVIKMDVAENIAYHVQRMQLLSLTPNVYQSNESFVRQVEAITQIPQVLSQEFIDTVDSKYKVNKDTYVSSRSEIRNSTQSNKGTKKSFADILGSEIFIKESKVNKVNKSETEDYIEREVKTMCNHDPNDENTSLKKMNKRMMVFPAVSLYTCSCCNKGFKFKKNNDGRLEEIKDE